MLVVHGCMPNLHIGLCTRRVHGPAHHVERPWKHLQPMRLFVCQVAAECFFALGVALHILQCLDCSTATVVALSMIDDVHLNDAIMTMESP